MECDATGDCSDVRDANVRLRVGRVVEIGIKILIEFTPGRIDSSGWPVNQFETVQHLPDVLQLLHYYSIMRETGKVGGRQQQRWNFRDLTKLTVNPVEKHCCTHLQAALTH